jgi:hypothetical protein
MGFDPLQLSRDHPIAPFEGSGAGDRSDLPGALSPTNRFGYSEINLVT